MTAALPPPFPPFCHDTKLPALGAYGRVRDAAVWKAACRRTLIAQWTRTALADARRP